jgi:hypothetical protein
MLPFRLNRTRELDPTTGQPVTTVSYRFPVSDLLDSPKCPATIKNEFRDKPETELDVRAVVDEAMTAMNRVLLELVKISMPELTVHIAKLRRIFMEASGMPLLLRVKPPSAGSRSAGLNVEMTPLHDLQFLVQNAPIPGAS